VLNRDILSDRRQLGLFGLALLFIILPTHLGFLQRTMGLQPVGFDRWLVCIALAIALLLVDEAIKFFLRRSRA
jgi:Ca2+-transporting ATPase